MKLGTVFSVFAALLVAASAVSADPGQTGLTFLKMGQGARAMGMGGAFSTVADDASATYWNPAGCIDVGDTEVLLSHAGWVQGIDMENVAIARSHGDHGFGLSFTVLRTDEIEMRDVDGTRIGHFRFFDFAIQGSYAHNIGDRLVGGVSVKALYEQIDEETATGFAVDIGGILNLPVDGLRVGACVQHLGAKMKFIDESFDLPLTIRGGLSYRLTVPFLSDESIVAFEIQKPREDDLKTHFGIEVGLVEKLALRFGYRTGYDNQNVSVGVGIPVNKYRLDYAYVPFYSDLGDVHRVTFGIGL
ncbi:MAG: PorV/PorQ family protein [Candidatus Eisenbacteria sp.]|nr:PorV/PorQ family protein [Candidatus Eisenbacteria bacterium]